jgi:hypothetical protein
VSARFVIDSNDLQEVIPTIPHFFISSFIFHLLITEGPFQRQARAIKRKIEVLKNEERNDEIEEEDDGK